MKIILIVMVLSLSSCAFHYRNQKGVELKGKDFQMRAGTIEKGKAHFYSELEIWFPYNVRN